MMCKILKVFYVLFTLIVFLSEAVLSLSRFILINSALTMQLAFKNVIQCQKLVRKKLSDLEEHSGGSQGSSFEKSCTNSDRNGKNLFRK